jgi:hypothetical protein
MKLADRIERLERIIILLSDESRLLTPHTIKKILIEEKVIG